jgi:SAM-dependent methyltransferase
VSIIKCDFCGSLDYEEVYKPIGTKRNNRVCICNQCGLMFSIHDDIPYSREPNPSGDADWGNIRFCKTQRFGALQDQLPSNIDRVIDVGSSRGHFVRWLQEENPKAEITALEPDGRVSPQYHGNVHYLNARLEDVDLPSDYYDFAYCCQTLEHSDSASAMLKQIYNILKPGGQLFVEVPNIEVLRFKSNVEEFFIDKHNFHFGREPLGSYLRSYGFNIVRENRDNLNVRLFAEKGAEHGQVIGGNPRYGRELVAEYAANIQRNRAKLPAIAAQITEMLDHMRVAFFGANVLFDLLVKYGGLDPKRVECLVDGFIYEYLPAIHGVPVQHPNQLRVYQPDVCVVLARFGAEIVAKQARAFNIRNVVKFYDLLEAA